MPRLRTSVAALLVAALAAGCPAATTPTKRGERLRIRSFTDPSPVIDLAVAGSFVFAASASGLDRFDLRSGARLTLDANHGLDTDRVYALGVDRARELMWIATDRGVTKLSIGKQTFVDLPDPPAEVTAGLEHAVLAAAGDDSVFVGGRFGLYRATGGRWQAAGVKEPITSLVRTADGGLWVGTDTGLKLVQDSGTSDFGPAQGCDLARVQHVVEGPSGGPLAFGVNAEGQSRVVMMIDGRCASYRVSPQLDWSHVASTRDRVLAVAGERLYVFKVATGLRRLGRDQIELLPAPPKDSGLVPPSPLTITALSERVPGGVTSLHVDGDHVLVGTKDLGTGHLDGVGRWTWYRRGELTRDARFLSIACVARDDCFIGNAVRGWRFDGKTFRDPGLGERTPIAFVRRPDGGDIYSLFRLDDGGIGLASFTKGAWQELPGVAIRLADGATELSFARFAPGGLLWLGVGYVDEQGDVRPKGVALIDIALGAVSYHHASNDENAKKRGILPVPINTVDAAFIGTDEVWLATTQGAARVRGTDVKVFSESDGMRSEILRGIACSAAGMVYVGSRQGVGAFDGEKWTNPSGLTSPVNDLQFAADGRLWMGTDRGLVSFDGATIRRLDSRRGLIEDRVVELDIDQFGRLWVRGPEAIAVVVP